MTNVTVIMPCFNHARFLTDSINSVLRQTYSDLELVIVDDCSTDDSWAVINSLASGDGRIQAIRQEQNQGLSKARNAALRRARGEFIAFCDSDDVWECDKIRIQMDLLDRNPNHDVAYCDTIIINENGLPTGKRFSQLYPPPKQPSGWLFPDLIKGNFINIQSVLLRANRAQPVERFDEQIEWIQDWWYWVRLSRKHRFLYSQEPLARYRIHSGSTNVVHHRSYCVNRFRVFRRMLREYTDLPPTAKADIVYQMGVNLCEIGKYRVGRRLLWDAVGRGSTGMRAFGTSLRALRRMVLYTATRKHEDGHGG